MIALQIEDRKQFTAQLFVGDLFDHFFVRDVVITTYNTFTIDGRIKKGYYSQEEAKVQGEGEYSRWQNIKPFCYDLIKGKRLPEAFQIQLLLSGEQAGEYLGLSTENIQGLYLGIRYEGGKINCVTGVSLKTFVADKTVEQQWDLWVQQFFKKYQMVFC